MDIKSKNMDLIVLFLLELVTGILILINPVKFTSTIIIIAGVILLVNGVINVIKYFKAKPEEAMLEQSLASGLICLLLGGVCTFNSNWFIDSFPIISVLYGIMILVSGLVKVQRSVDLLRLKSKYWLFSAIGAILSIIFAIVVITNPFATTVVLWRFTGVALIIGAIADIVSIIFGNVAEE